MPLDAPRFRHTMSHLVTGVTVVTARVGGPAGAVGLTASSVTSLSLEPPMLLVCVGHDSQLHDALVRAERFAVNVLAADQVEVARRFADRGRQRLGDGEVTWSPGGAPLIPGALAQIECRRSAHLPGGDHTILTGTLEWAWTADGGGEGRDARGRPLCYFRGGYTVLG